MRELPAGRLRTRGAAVSFLEVLGSPWPDDAVSLLPVLTLRRTTVPGLGMKSQLCCCCPHATVAALRSVTAWGCVGVCAHVPQPWGGRGGKKRNAM